jgi:hypothetical protein
LILGIIIWNYSKTIDKLRDKLQLYKVDGRLAEFYCLKITELLLFQFDTRTGNKKLRANKEEEEAYSKLADWLDRCGRKRRLDFNPRDKSYALKRSLKIGIKPMKLETMKNNYYDMYVGLEAKNDITK